MRGVDDGAVRQGAQRADADGASWRRPGGVFKVGRRERLRGSPRLMADAGLTNGAFYAHFASKDDLVAGVVAEQLGAANARPSRLCLPTPASSGSCAGTCRSSIAITPATAARPRPLPDGDRPLRRRGPAGLHRRSASLVIDVIAARLEPDDPSSARAHPRDVRGDGQDACSWPAP